MATDLQDGGGIECGHRQKHDGVRDLIEASVAVAQDRFELLARPSDRGGEVVRHAAIVGEAGSGGTSVPVDGGRPAGLPAAGWGKRMGGPAAGEPCHG